MMRNPRRVARREENGIIRGTRGHVVPVRDAETEGIINLVTRTTTGGDIGIRGAAKSRIESRSASTRRKIAMSPDQGKGEVHGKLDPDDGGLQAPDPSPLHLRIQGNRSMIPKSGNTITER